MSPDLEGRLAALELTGVLALELAALQLAGTGLFARVPELVDQVQAAIDSGAVPVPTDPEARAVMRAQMGVLLGRLAQDLRPLVPVQAPGA